MICRRSNALGRRDAAVRPTRQQAQHGRQVLQVLGVSRWATPTASAGLRRPPPPPPPSLPPSLSPCRAPPKLRPAQQPSARRPRPSVPSQAQPSCSGHGPDVAPHSGDMSTTRPSHARAMSHRPDLLLTAPLPLPPTLPASASAVYAPWHCASAGLAFDRLAEMTTRDSPRLPETTRD